MQTEYSAPATGMMFRFGGRLVHVRDTFAVSQRLEAHFGPLHSFFERKRADYTLIDLADFFGCVVSGQQIGPEEISLHISEIGVLAAWDELERLMVMILHGWQALSAEAGADTSANPQQPVRKGPGRPRGARNRVKEVSPGATSSELPSSPASASVNSGDAHQATLLPCCASDAAPQSIFAGTETPAAQPQAANGACPSTTTTSA